MYIDVYISADRFDCILISGNKQFYYFSSFKSMVYKYDKNRNLISMEQYTKGRKNE